MVEVEREADLSSSWSLHLLGSEAWKKQKPQAGGYLFMGP